jgi:hypothetical protein
VEIVIDTVLQFAPAGIVKRDGEPTDEELPRMNPPLGAEPVELEV